MAPICDGLVVLELGSGSIAASLCGMLLADNGARVIKVEPPEGDRLRREQPNGFLVWCRGKESLIADLRTDDGRQQLLELARTADVVVEAFGTGVAEAWGVGSDTLCAANPLLVHCAISAFGRTGGYAHLKGFEPVVAAKAGLGTAGVYTGRAARPGPFFVNAPLASVGAGHQACAGVLAALTARETTGRGQAVEATLIQGLHSLDYFRTMHWQYELQLAGDGPKTMTPFAAVARPPALLCSRDGRWINSSPTLPHQLVALKRVLGIDLEAPFADDTDAVLRYQDAFIEAFRHKPLGEWLPLLLDEPDIAFEVARTSEEGLDHPQAVHNGMVVEVDDPVVGRIQEIGPVAAFAETPSVIARSAPALDEHGPLPAAVAPVTAPAEGGRLRHALDGVTVVELGYFYAMPAGVAAIGALGARVIKVEGLEGDPMRTSFGPPETGAVKTMEGKESIAVDASTDAGREILHELLRRADVFVFGFRPSVAQRLGVDYESVRRLNPRIVYLHAAGYGVDGPYAERPLYASPASSTAGCYHRQCGSWLDPALAAGKSVEELKELAGWLQPPVDGDSNAALGVLSALSLAIYHQRRTGTGQFLSTTMIGGNAYSFADDYCRYEGKPAVPLPDREQFGLHALYRVYPARSGYVFVGALSQAEWEELAAALERQDLVDDERFATAPARAEHDAELIAALGGVFAERSASQWEAAVGTEGIAVVEVYEGEMADFTNTDGVLRELGLVGEVDHPLFGRILRHGIPVRFSETPGRLAPGCLLGQHTEALLLELGRDQDEIDRLAADGVIGRAEVPVTR